MLITNLRKSLILFTIPGAFSWANPAGIMPDEEHRSSIVDGVIRTIQSLRRRSLSVITHDTLQLLVDVGSDRAAGLIQWPFDSDDEDDERDDGVSESFGECCIDSFNHLPPPDMALNCTDTSTDTMVGVSCTHQYDSTEISIHRSYCATTGGIAHVEIGAVTVMCSLSMGGFPLSIVSFEYLNDTLCVPPTSNCAAHTLTFCTQWEMLTALNLEFLLGDQPDFSNVFCTALRDNESWRSCMVTVSDSPPPPDDDDDDDDSGGEDDDSGGEDDDSGGEDDEGCEYEECGFTCCDEDEVCGAYGCKEECEYEECGLTCCDEYEVCDASGCRPCWNDECCDRSCSGGEWCSDNPSCHIGHCVECEYDYNCGPDYECNCRKGECECIHDCCTDEDCGRHEVCNTFSNSCRPCSFGECCDRSCSFPEFCSDNPDCRIGHCVECDSEDDCSFNEECDCRRGECVLID